jgi:hypothetical protein
VPGGGKCAVKIVLERDRERWRANLLNLGAGSVASRASFKSPLARALTGRMLQRMSSTRAFSSALAASTSAGSVASTVLISSRFAVTSASQNRKSDRSACSNIARAKGEGGAWIG